MHMMDKTHWTTSFRQLKCHLSPHDDCTVSRRAVRQLAHFRCSGTALTNSHSMSTMPSRVASRARLRAEVTDHDFRRSDRIWMRRRGGLGAGFDSNLLSAMVRLFHHKTPPRFFRAVMPTISRQAFRAILF